MKTSLSKILILALFAQLLPFTAHADEEGGLWLGVTMEKKLPKKWWKNADDFSVNAGASYRLDHNFTQSSRIDASVGLDYKINKYLKAGVGYVFIHAYKPGELDPCYDKEGNLEDDEFNWDNSYWRNRHRGLFEITGKVKFGRFTLSLRERYQYTSFSAVTYQKDKYKLRDLRNGEGEMKPDNIKETWVKNDPDLSLEPVYEYRKEESSGDNSWDDDFWGEVPEEEKLVPHLVGYRKKHTENNDWPRMKEKERKDEHVLRSRIKLDYDIKGCPLAPFVSYEIHNFLNDGMKIDKHRISAGADWKIDKKHKLGIAYLLNAPDFKKSTVREIVLDLRFKFDF